MNIFKIISHGLVLLLALLVASCARMGRPDGGWYDETPPSVIGATPGDGSVNAKAKKINIFFDEFIKLENASEKVVVSPPQLEQPEIKATGKRISVELKDSLKDNTTYTVDFSDAISDNNEGNPLGNYTYSFSTGEEIDTLEVSGYVVQAENLEPVKGILVGLYAEWQIRRSSRCRCCAWHEPTRADTSSYVAWRRARTAYTHSTIWTATTASRRRANR